MDGDQLCAVSWRSRPGTFVSLMTLYESNYIRLRWILSAPEAIEGHQVSNAPGDVGLHLQVLERCRFTTTLRMSYLLESSKGPLLTPDIQVRVYHDARLAEACSCSGWRRAIAFRQQLGEHIRDLGDLRREMGERWARNMLLNKWLEYCAERGHRFQVPGRAESTQGMQGVTY
jgi:uncharacterized protein YqiB (DUF1249 family)